MITKEDFVKFMNFVLEEQETNDAISDIYRKHRNIVGDAEYIFPMGGAMIIELLEKAMGLPYDEQGNTDLSWWAYEADFGRDKEALSSFEIISLPEDHKFRHPKLDTLEELYDFLIFSKEE